MNKVDPSIFPVSRALELPLLGTCVLAVTYSVSSRAGGIYLYEISNVSETGYAGAGMVARANDAGTVFTNPAGMTRFDAPKLIASGTLVLNVKAVPNSLLTPARCCLHPSGADYLFGLGGT